MKAVGHCSQLPLGIERPANYRLIDGVRVILTVLVGVVKAVGHCSQLPLGIERPTHYRLIDGVRVVLTVLSWIY